MSWLEDVEGLAQRRALLARGADPIRLGRAVAQNKLRIRERAALLADPGSFRPRGGLSGGQEMITEDGQEAIMPSGGLLGRCTVDGRPVVFTGNDSTARVEGRGGAHGQWPHYHRRGTSRAEQFAYHQRAPLVRVLDAPGASVKMYEGAGRPEVVWNVWADATAQLLATVPVVSVVAGAAAGLPAIETNLGHFSVIVRGNGQSFPGGPPVVKVALGYEVSKEDLGGADLLAPIGIIDCVANDEQEAFGMVRSFLSYLPTNCWQTPPVGTAAAPARNSEDLIAAVSRDEPRTYDPYAILEMVFDAGSVFEMAERAGPECITAFARVDGFPVGLAIKKPNTPSSGALGVIATEKLARHIELCDTFHLPFIAFTDEPGVQGFDAGPGADVRGIVRARAQLIQAIYSTHTPWMSVVIGRAHGMAGSLSRRPHDFWRHVAWPSGYWESADGRGERLPTFAANDLYGVDDIIDPRDTRQFLGEFLATAQSVIATQLGPVTSRPAYRV